MTLSPLPQEIVKILSVEDFLELVDSQQGAEQMRQWMRTPDDHGLSGHPLLEECIRTLCATEAQEKVYVSICIVCAYASDLI